MKILQITFSLVLCLLFISCNKEEKQEASSETQKEVYTGLPEFKEAYTTVQESMRKNATYDIERTIKVMNTLDVAMENNGNLEEFLQSFAKTDFFKGCARNIE